MPDDPVLTENAVVEMDHNGNVSVAIQNTGEDSMVRIHATGYGSAGFVIRDGENVYRYTVVVYEDDGGHSQIRIIPEDGQ